MLVFTLCLQGNIENSPAKIILIIIFSITYTGAVVAGCVTSCSDTTDPLLRKNSDDLNIEFKEHLYCHICHSKVQIKTRHCKVCNLYSSLNVDASMVLITTVSGSIIV